MADDPIRQFLGENAFFAGSRADDLSFLAGHASLRTLAAGEPLFHHGEPARHFYMVRDGGIVLEIIALEGPTLELQRLGPGTVIGWSWLIAPYKWSFNARADTSTEIVEIEGAAVLERCEQDPVFGYDLLKRFSALMSERLAHARRRMMEEWQAPGFA